MYDDYEERNDRTATEAEAQTFGKGQPTEGSIMQFVEAKQGDVVNVRTTWGTISLVVMDQEIIVRGLYEGDGSTRRPRLIPARSNVESVTFAPNPS